MNKKILQIILFIVPIFTAMHTEDVKDILLKFNCFDTLDGGIRAGIIQLTSIVVSICIGIIVFACLNKYFKTDKES
jgi:hypothetical protein